MKTIRLLLILILSSWGYDSSCADTDEMPIIAFYGLPSNATSDDFRIFSECGFNVTHRWHDSLEQLVRSCRLGQQYGVRVIAHCPQVSNAPAKAAATLRGEPGFFGYFIADEPTLPQIRQSQQLIEQLRPIDDSHCFYINLFPYYYPDKLMEMLKTNSYTSYLQAASATSCRQLSFDFYPVLNDSIRHTWYHNLEMVRAESLSSGKPFWGFVCSVPHADYPMPTLASLRLQVYSNLAYGAQAIQYYTYWTPDDGQGFHYHDAPISRDGKKTKTYAVVQQMNRELKTVARLFYGAKVVSVHHLGTIAEGTTRLSTVPVNLRMLKVVGRQGAIVSQFEKSGHRYLAIVNKSHEEPLTIRIRPGNGTPRHITKKLQTEAMKTSYRVEPGDLLLFRLY